MLDLDRYNKDEWYRSEHMEEYEEYEEEQNKEEEFDCLFEYFANNFKYYFFLFQDELYKAITIDKKLKERKYYGLSINNKNYNGYTLLDLIKENKDKAITDEEQEYYDYIIGLLNNN